MKLLVPAGKKIKVDDRIGKTIKLLKQQLLVITT
jgi:hypothetical protein